MCAIRKYKNFYLEEKEDEESDFEKRFEFSLLFAIMARCILIVCMFKVNEIILL